MDIWPFSLLYSATPTIFTCDYGLDKAVAKVSAETLHWSYMMSFGEGVVGRVEEGYVALQWKAPFFSHSFKPVYYGSFHSINGKALLTGRFSMALSTRIFHTLWIGLFGVVCILSVVDFANGGSGIGAQLPKILLIWLFGILLVPLGQRFSRKDVDRLANALSRALGGQVITRGGFPALATSLRATPEELLELCFAKKRRSTEDFYTCDACGRTCLREELAGEVCPYCFGQGMQE